MATKTQILDFAHGELKGFMNSLGESAFRADQIMNWVYKRLAVSFAEMTDLPLSLREKLEKDATISALKPIEEKISDDSMTRKALFELCDGETIESGFMMYAPAGVSRERGTVCVSSQVGCYASCPFCATGGQGFTRNLSTGEIVEQVLYFIRTLNNKKEPQSDVRRPVTNVVFMGMGEPLANYDNVMRAVTVLNSKEGLNISSRQITLSTSGLVPQIRRLMNEKIKVELAVSLHAPNNKLRSRLVPVNRKYPLNELIPVCREYFEKTGRRVTFEYALFRGVNDSGGSARELAALLCGLGFHVNLIIGNPAGEPGFKGTNLEQAYAFHKMLTMGGVMSTLRESRGADIEAGCGQLKSRHLTVAGRGRE